MEEMQNKENVWSYLDYHQYKKYRINSSLRIAMRDALRSTVKCQRKWEALVGYTVDELKCHLEKRFKPGMTWENFGKWHIDHIIPVFAFNYEKVEHEDFRRCWALKNLQPLWARENLVKGTKMSRHFQPMLMLDW